MPTALRIRGALLEATGECITVGKRETRFRRENGFRSGFAGFRSTAAKAAVRSPSLSRVGEYLSSNLGERRTWDAGATQDRMSRNPTGQRAPPFVMWRLDWCTSLLEAMEPVSSAGAVNTYRVSRGIGPSVRRSHPKPDQPRSSRATGSQCGFMCSLPPPYGGGNRHEARVAACLPPRDRGRSSGTPPAAARVEGLPTQPPRQPGCWKHSTALCSLKRYPSPARVAGEHTKSTYTPGTAALSRIYRDYSLKK